MCNNIIKQIENNILGIENEMHEIQAQIYRLNNRKQYFEKKWNQCVFNSNKHREIVKCINRAQQFFDKHNNPLPIYKFEYDIMSSVKQYSVTILSAETGSGKSTQVVQYLLDSGNTSSGKILCIQPRRKAASSIAERVSEEMKFPFGELVGYQVGGGGKFYYCSN